MPHKTFKRCAYGALFCSLANMLALIGSAVFIKNGTALVSLEDRKDYLNTFAAQWSMGWFLWMLAAISLFIFYRLITKIISGGAHNKVLTYALIATAVGVSFDISAHIGFIILPYLTSKPDYIFLEREQLFTFMTGFIANGLYTLAGTIIFYQAYKLKTLPKWLIFSAIPVGIGGYWLCAATIKNCPPCMMYAVIVLMSFFVLWSAIVSLWAFGKAKI